MRRMVMKGAALTRREIQVLDHLAEGCPAKEIASLLQISPLTVSKHLQNVYRKLDAKNRVHAVVLHWRGGEGGVPNDPSFPVP